MMKTKRWLLGLGVLAAVAALLVWKRSSDSDALRLGVMAGVEEEVAAVVKQVAARDGLKIRVIAFSDYTLPNAALDAGELDANAFQHQPYLDAQIRDRGYRISSLAATIVAPIRLYSRKYDRLEQLPRGAKIGIPNDPSNGGRALNLLASHGLLEIAPGKGLQPSVYDLTANPRQWQWIELDAGQLARALDDLDAAVINTDHAINGGLDPRKDSLLAEHRENNPYQNFIAVRTQDLEKPVFQKLRAAWQSREVSDFLEQRFHGAIEPAW